MLVTCLLIAAASASLLVGAGHVTELNVDEEQPIRTLIGNVRENPDVMDLLTAGESLRFNLRFSSGRYELFAVDDRSGDLYTSRRIDREQLCPGLSTCSVELDITVLPLRVYRILKVVVNVVDINDNSPSFPQPRVTLEIKESSAIGSQIAVPAAEDADVGQFGVQRYELSQSSDSGEVFRLSVSAERGPSLTVVRRLDREHQPRHSLTLSACDGGSPAKSGSVDIQV